MPLHKHKITIWNSLLYHKIKSNHKDIPTQSIISSFINTMTAWPRVRVRSENPYNVRKHLLHNLKNCHKIDSLNWIEGTFAYLLPVLVAPSSSTPLLLRVILSHNSHQPLEILEIEQHMRRHKVSTFLLREQWLTAWFPLVLPRY